MLHALVTRPPPKVAICIVIAEDADKQPCNQRRQVCQTWMMDNMYGEQEEASEKQESHQLAAVIDKLGPRPRTGRAKDGCRSSSGGNT